MVDVEDFSSCVVVGYDGSAVAIAALYWAAAEAARRDEDLVVLHALDYGAILVGPVVDSLVPEETKKYGQLVTEEGATRARQAFPKLTVRTAALIGGAASTLIEVSGVASLIVVGTRGHGEVVGALLGSVAFQVTTHSHSPVVVVRGDSSHLPGPDRPIVVGIDGSEASDLALDTAAAHAASVGAELRIVTAYRVRGGESLASAWSAAYIAELYPDRDPEAEQRAAAERVLTAGHDRVRQAYPDLAVTMKGGRGAAAGVLTDESGDAALLVVGARGRGGFASLVLGSVSRAVIHLAQCPVEVVRKK